MSRAETLAGYVVFMFLFGLIAAGIGISASQVSTPNPNEEPGGLVSLVPGGNYLIQAFGAIWTLMTFQADINPVAETVVFLFLFIVSIYTLARLVRGGG